jgi:hypothetical protein
MASWVFQKKRMPIRSPIVRWPQTSLKQYLLDGNDGLWLASKRDIGMETSLTAESSKKCLVKLLVQYRINTVFWKNQMSAYCYLRNSDDKTNLPDFALPDSNP